MASRPHVIKLSERELRAWQALLHAHQDVNRKLDNELRADHDLSLSGYDVLLRLVRAPKRSLRMSVLAERVMMPPSSLTRVVDGLVAEGLVERSRVAHDARAMVARLTDRGRQVLRQAASTHLRGIRQHFTGRLTHPQMEELVTILETITGPHEPH